MNEYFPVPPHNYTTKTSYPLALTMDLGGGSAIIGTYDIIKQQSNKQYNYHNTR